MTTWPEDMSAAWAEKASRKGEGVHRLTNIETREVSVVDSPANLRPFLVVKGGAGVEVGMSASAAHRFLSVAGSPVEKIGEGRAPRPPAQDSEQALDDRDRRNAMVEAVADALEKLAGAAQTLKQAPDKAPPELPKVLELVARDLMTAAARAVAKSVEWPIDLSEAAAQRPARGPWGDECDLSPPFVPSDWCRRITTGE